MEISILYEESAHTRVKFLKTRGAEASADFHKRWRKVWP